MPVTVVSYLITALELGPKLVALGLDLAGFVGGAVAKAKVMRDENRDPTPEEWDELNARVQDVHQRIQAL